MTTRTRQCDLDHLLQSLAGNKLVVLELVRTFLSIYPLQVESFDAALRDKDWIRLGSVVHDLRGSCAILSASTPWVLAIRLEETLQLGMELDIYENCARFREALADAAAELHQFVETNCPGPA